MPKHFLIFAFKLFFADTFAHDLKVEFGQFFNLYLMTRVIRLEYALEKNVIIKFDNAWLYIIEICVFKLDNKAPFQKYNYDVHV